MENDIISYTQKEIPKILNTIGINNYAIGGSIAMILHWIKINRTPHDIDIIVPKGTIKIALQKIKNAGYNIISDRTGEDRIFIWLFTFMPNDDIKIDVLQSISDDFNYKIIDGLPVIDLKNIIQAKKIIDKEKEKHSKDIMAIESILKNNKEK